MLWLQPEMNILIFQCMSISQRRALIFPEADHDLPDQCVKTDSYATSFKSSSA